MPSIAILDYDHELSNDLSQGQYCWQTAGCFGALCCTSTQQSVWLLLSIAVLEYDLELHNDLSQGQVQVRN